MHSTSPRAAARPARSPVHLNWRALAALLVSSVLIGTGSAAFAHDSLTDSSPAEGETLTEPPTQVRLTFSAEVLELGAAAVVTDSDGATWEAGEPSADGAEVTVPLKDGLPNGSYEASWRVTSSDGHPISGVIPFTVDAPEAPTESAPADAAPSTAPADAGSATTAETSETTESAAQPAVTTNEPAPTTASEAAQDSAGTEADNGGVPWVPLVIGLVVLLAALGMYAVVRRRGVDQ